MLDIISHGDIVELQLNRPPANALNHELLEALLAAHREVIEVGARGLILSGQAGMFCAGVDVPELLGHDRASIHRFWSLLFQSAKALATSPVPVVAALAGHSPAGGAVLVANCDYRVAAQGTFKIGFNEVQVGLPLPSTILLTFTELVGPRLARYYGVAGRLMLMDEALDIGFIDELVPAERVLERSLEFLDGLLALPPVAMNRTRLTGKAVLIAALGESDDVERVTADWFSDETQVALHALVDSLGKN